MISINGEYTKMLSTLIHWIGFTMIKYDFMLFPFTKFLELIDDNEAPCNKKRSVASNKFECRLFYQPDR